MKSTIDTKPLIHTVKIAPSVVVGAPTQDDAIHSATRILFRLVLGAVLRARRQESGRTLREVSRAAQVSLGYLSEIERGQKEASSELISAVCGALNLKQSQIFSDVATQMALAELANDFSSVTSN